MAAAPPSNYAGVLLDIEGTTSSIRFVFDVMFPYVRDSLRDYLDKHHGDSACRDACRQIVDDAKDAGTKLRLGDLSEVETREELVRHVFGLMDADVKATGLKKLQGLIWQAAFEGGEMSAHVYPDVVPALKRWQAAGVPMWIYSSGSVHAQKLFFGHTIEGNLLPYFSNHWDTTVGGKKDAASYRAILSEIQASTPVESGQLLFVSDVPEELDAAREAGFQTCLSVRECNRPVDDACDHRRVESFGELL